MRPGLTMNEVAELLGPPPSWMPDPAAGPAPAYWMYDFLEINFRCATDFACHWFQIEHANGLNGDAVRLADDLFMSLDGVSGKSPVSRFIESIDDIDRVQVYFSMFPPSASSVMWIDDVVEVWFDGSDALEDAIRDRVDHAAIVRLIEAGSVVNSIYSYGEVDETSARYRRERLAELEHLRVSGREFLAALSPSHTAAS